MGQATIGKHCRCSSCNHRNELMLKTIQLELEFTIYILQIYFLNKGFGCLSEM